MQGNRSVAAVGSLMVVMSAACFSLEGVWTVLLQDYGLSSFFLSGLRLGFSLLFAGILLLLQRADFTMSRRQVVDVAVFGGFCVTMTTVLYAMATHYLPVGLVGLCHYVYPLLVVLVSCVLFRERLTGYKVAAGVLMLLGLFLTSGGGAVSLFGITLALATAVTFGAYVIALEHSSLGELSGLKLQFYIALFGGVGLFLGLWVGGELSFPAAPRVYVIQAVGALISQISGMMFLVEGVKRIGATKAAFLSILEPVFALLWDFLLFHTGMTQITWIGVVFMFASFLLILKESPEAPIAEAEQNHMANMDS